MIILSEQFQKAAGKVYTFGLLAVFLQYVPIKTITVNGIRAEVENLSNIIGLLGLLCLFLTIVCIVYFIRDWLKQRLSDNLKLGERSVKVSNKAPEMAELFDVHYSRRYQIFAFIAFIIEGISPIFLGCVASYMSIQDMLLFFGVYKI